ncbi:Calx-beta domain-containing protein [Sulfurospirillum multivorans]|nr:Calx-beta domain-containing protein [Sulfurospirillum multivorans]
MKKNSLIFNVMKTFLFFICIHTLLFAESPDYPGNCSNPTTASTFGFLTSTSTINKLGNATYTRYWNGWGWWGEWVYTEDNDFFLLTTPKAGTLTITISGSNAFFTTANNSCPTRNSTSRTTYTIHLDSATTNFNIGVFSNLGFSPDYTLSVTFTPDIITPSFSIADTTLNEGNAGIYTKNIPVTLSDTDGNTVTVNYATSNGTATTGSDYNATSGTLTFSGSTTIQNIPVKINGDTTNENDEYFYITLSNATGGATIKDNRATITLLNDDGGAVHSGGRDFLIRNPISTQNIKGNIKVIGNTVLCYKQNGQCVDTNSANNQVSLSFIDTSSTVHTYNNSSQAQISSVPSTAKVLWAGLYTQGYMGRNYNDTTSALMGTPVYLITPSGTSIATTPNVIDVYEYTDNHYTYSTFSEVPTLKGMTGSQINGYFTGANIKAREGDDDGTLGYFAAWSLVVIYQDDSESLKNISVFDGYKRVSNDTGYQNVDITVDGFLTPTSGNVNSALSVFIGEGDKNIVGDSIFLNNIQIPDVDNDNAFNSTVNGFTPNPNPVNFQGIDIHNYDVGIDGNTSHAQIIGNSETSATIRLHTERYTDNSSDTYFPSMVAFTTELYEPRVCYVEAYYTEDGNTTLTSANVGDIITIKTWIANMKKDASDGNLETAEKVEITMEHDDTNLAYQSESTKIQNVGESAYSSKTDASDSDIATFISDTNSSVWHIRTGANATNGGDLTPNVTNDAANKAYISFKEKIQTSGDITIANIYKVSYENSSMGLRIGDESPVNIGVCKDFNASIAVSAPLGVFNVVNQNFTGTTDPKDTTSSLNALYTQIAGKAFNVKVLALDSDYITLKSYTGDVNLSLVTTPNYLASETDDQKQAKCNAATSLTDAKTISFANENSKTVTLDDYTKAYKDISFKITYDNNGTISYVCSRDNFSIRPERYSIDLNETKLIGGKQYLFDLNATLYQHDTNISGYNQTIPQTIDQNVSEGLAPLFFPATCIGLNTDRTIATPAVTFTEGSNKTTRYTFNNVGKVLISIDDKLWTKIDQSAYNSKGYSDCIENSSSSAANNGQIGCTISGSKTFTFVPKQFNNELALQNFNDGNFTYLSNDGNMSAILRLTTTAILDDNATATFYTAGCYAEDVNYTISVRNFNLFNNTTRNLIHYFKDENDTTSILVNNLVAGEGNFSSTEGNFTNGVAQNLKMLFNFDRNSTQAYDPFKIAKSDFNITAIIDDQNTTGSDFNRTTDQNATFYYGRVYSTDYRGTSPINTTIRYEVYCKDCNRTDMNITGMQSPTSLNWYQNTFHVITDGNVTTFSSIGTTLINDLNTTTSGFIANGIENNTLGNAVVPYTDRIQMTPSSWLLYNQYNAGATTNDFTVEFIRAGNWAGQGNLGRTVDVNTSIRTNRRMEW